MCGLIGNFGYIENIEFSNHIKDVLHLLQRRGPDQINTIDLENFFSVHSRLIVQGTEQDGKQPMQYKNKIILFNGNLYNKNSLKLELESKGYQFKGVSDTEVVAISMHYWGSKAFKKFNGFFSIASFDSDSKTLTLARDKLGQKPLYYAKNDKSLFFGSTENLIPKKYYGGYRSESFLDFITYGFIPSPNTMYENLFSINPGSFIEFLFEKEKIVMKKASQYWKPIISNEIENFDLATQCIASSIDDAVRDGMKANTDIACLLSGGVDSSLILSNARKFNENICAITADFGENDDAEARSTSLAKILKHKNHLIKNITKKDITESLRLTSQVSESPFDDTSLIPSNIVFSSVKKSGYSVALTGDGADELFCGYSSFENLKKLEKFLDKKFDLLFRYPEKLFHKLFKNLRGFDLERIFMSEDELLTDLSCNGFKIREWDDVINTNYDPLHHVKGILEELDGLRPLDKLRILNLRFKLSNQILYKADRASMFNSVEARPLFLHNSVIDSALSISSNAMLKNGQKSILKKVYQSQIPHSGWSLPKKGFGWKTNSYQNIFTTKDNNFLMEKTGIDGDKLLKNRKRHHKRGFYGLFSLVSWLKTNSFKP